MERKYQRTIAAYYTSWVVSSPASLTRRMRYAALVTLSLGAGLLVQDLRVDEAVLTGENYEAVVIVSVVELHHPQSWETLSYGNSIILRVGCY